MKKSKSKTTSLVLPDDVKDVIEENASAENMKPAAMYRKLIYTGLKELYGIKVSNNRVIEH